MSLDEFVLFMDKNLLYHNILIFENLQLELATKT